MWWLSMAIRRAPYLAWPHRREDPVHVLRHVVVHLLFRLLNTPEEKEGEKKGG